MRPEKKPWDLNNLPEDYIRDGKQVFEEGSSTGAGHRKMKTGSKDGKDECGKAYECRFCSLKFCKSQALGGHMNRHRQGRCQQPAPAERETETLNKARQLVFQHNDNLAAQGSPHLGCHMITPGSYHPADHIGDPFRSMYPPPRLFSSGSSSTHISPPPPQPPQYPPYSSPTSLSHTSQYPPHAVNELYVGHVLSSSSPHSKQYPYSNQNLSYMDSNYTCIGAPIGHGYVASSSRGSNMAAGSSIGRDGSLNNQDELLNWGRIYEAAGGRSQQQQRRLDHPSSINRFQDGF